MNDSAIIVIAKWPAPGTVKTRLAAEIGAEAAARLSSAFLADTIDLACSIAGATPLVAYAPLASRPQFAALCDGRCLLTPQPEDAFGVRLHTAFADAFALGFKRAVIIACDSPTLPPALLTQSLQLLDSNQVVIGPATDGGYYLLGMTALHERLFEAVDWSTDRVFSQTLERAQEIGFDATVLPPWYDIDEPRALAQLARDVERPGALCWRTRQALRELAINQETSMGQATPSGRTA